MTNLSLLQALVFEPRKAFTELDARPRFWWAMLVLAIASGLLTAWYTAVVDLAWVTDLQLRASALTQNMTEAEIERLATETAKRRGMQVVLGSISTAVVIVIVMLLSGLYYSLAGKITGVERSFRHWMALTAWSSMPTLLGLIPSALVLLTASSAQIPQGALQPLSLNELFIGRAVDEPGYTLFSSITLFQFLALYLAALGLKVWSGRSWLFSLVFTALPLVLIFGTWAFFSLR
jgi:hypothetical protein